MKIAETAHRIANEGVAEYVARRPDRFVGLGITTMQEPELATRELDAAITELGLKGVQILTNANGEDYRTRGTCRSSPKPRNSVLSS